MSLPVSRATRQTFRTRFPRSRVGRSLSCRWVPGAVQGAEWSGMNATRSAPRGAGADARGTREPQGVRWPAAAQRARADRELPRPPFSGLRSPDPVLRTPFSGPCAEPAARGAHVPVAVCGNSRRRHVGGVGATHGVLAAGRGVAPQLSQRSGVGTPRPPPPLCAAGVQETPWHMRVWRGHQERV